MRRIANYCPNCGERLTWGERSGRQRPICPACEHIVYFDPKVAVVVWIVRHDRVLLVQRAMDPGMGKWALPAGFVDHDEDPEDAAIREVQEETGYEVEIVRLLDVFPKRDNGLANIVIAYEARITGGSLEADDDAADAGWFTKDTLPEMVFYPSITLARRWQSGRL